MVLVQGQWLGNGTRYGLGIYTSVAKGLKLKVRMFGGLIPKFLVATGEKLAGGGGLFGPPSWIGLILVDSFLPKDITNKLCKNKFWLSPNVIYNFHCNCFS